MNENSTRNNPHEGGNNNFSKNKYAMTAFTDEKEKSNREDYNSKRIHNTASGKYTSLTEYESN